MFIILKLCTYKITKDLTYPVWDMVFYVHEHMLYRGKTAINTSPHINNNILIVFFHVTYALSTLGTQYLWAHSDTTQITWTYWVSVAI